MFEALIKINKLLDKKSKIQFLFLLLLLIVKSLLDGLGLGLIAPYITAISDSSVIFNNDLFNGVNELLKINTEQELILWMSITLIGFFIVKNLFSLYVMYYQSRLVFSKRSFQGKILFEAYMNAPYNYHLEHNSAELDRNIRFENTNVFVFIQSFLLLCSSIFLTISIFIVLLIANWQAALSMVCFIMLFSSLFLFLSSRYNKKFGIEVQVSQLHIGQALKEGLTSIIEAKLHSIESFFPTRYFKYMMLNARANWRQTTLGSTPTLFFEILAVGTLVGVIVILSVRNIDIKSVLPVLGLFCFAFIRLIPSVTMIIKSLQDIKFNVPSVDVVFDDFCKLFFPASQNSNKEDSTHQSIEFDSLVLENVQYAFSSKSDRNVIHKVNMKIDKGRTIGITGPSGAGKTTLINIILGLLKPTSGAVYINGENIHNDLKKWTRSIGYVPQTISLIDASIKENVALGLDSHLMDVERIWKVLKESNLDHFVNGLDNGIDTVIGENGVRISGGQRQRIGLARALYRDPEVLIFDEATSSLDSETEKNITSEIMKLAGLRTLIIVAHRISTIKDCDEIYYMKNGKIEDSGNFSELLVLNEDFRLIANEA